MKVTVIGALTIILIALAAALLMKHFSDRNDQEPYETRS
jgi:hypothetical protein